MVCSACTAWSVRGHFFSGPRSWEHRLVVLVVTVAVLLAWNFYGDKVVALSYPGVRTCFVHLQDVLYIAEAVHPAYL